MAITSKKAPDTKVPRAEPSARSVVRTGAFKASGPPPVAAGLILLGSGSRFGANWQETPAGLKIKRLSPGPLRSAGLEINDIIVSVNGSAATDRLMLEVRDQITEGSLRESAITVHRGERLLASTIRK